MKYPNFWKRIAAGSLNALFILVVTLILSQTFIGRFFASVASDLLQIGSPTTFWKGPLAMVISIFGTFFFSLPFTIFLFLGLHYFSKWTPGKGLVLMLRKSKSFFFIVFAIPVFFTSCSVWDQITSTETPETSKSKTIGVVGGVISLEDGTSLLVPVGAVNEDTEFSITKENNPARGTVSDLIRLKPEGVTFNAPLTIKIPYNSPAGEDQFVIVEHDSDFEVGVTPDYSSIVDTANDLVSTTTTHFSGWSILKDDGDVCCKSEWWNGAVRCYHRPLHECQGKSSNDEYAITYTLQSDPSQCDRVCCKSWASSTYKVESRCDCWNGAILDPVIEDESLCDEICCLLSDDQQERLITNMFKTSRGWCQDTESTVLEKEQCDNVCCRTIQGRFDWNLTRYECDLEDGVEVDDACCSSLVTPVECRETSTDTTSTESGDSGDTGDSGSGDTRGDSLGNPAEITDGTGDTISFKHPGQALSGPDYLDMTGGTVELTADDKLVVTFNLNASVSSTLASGVTYLSYGLLILDPDLGETSLEIMTDALWELTVSAAGSAGTFLKSTAYKWNGFGYFDQVISYDFTISGSTVSFTVPISDLSLTTADFDNYEFRFVTQAQVETSSSTVDWSADVYPSVSGSFRF